jgi:hypothetical protein
MITVMALLCACEGPNILPIEISEDRRTSEQPLEGISEKVGKVK